MHIQFAFVCFSILSLICSYCNCEHISLDDDGIEQYWIQFKNEFDKDYQSDYEHGLRFSIFRNNLEEITKHNVRYTSGLESYKMGINQFSDKTHTEYINETRCLSDNFKLLYNQIPIFDISNLTVSPIPLYKDWVAEGGVAPVKNQGHCGSCWAFSANGPLETQEWLRTKQMVLLSEQNLIDCTHNYGNHGCHGGFMGLAYQYIRENKGMNKDMDYPYEAREGRCRFKSNGTAVVANVKTFVRFHAEDEQNLKNVVGMIGTVSCALFSHLPSFRNYKEGIYYDKDCFHQQPTHAMIIVGYGTEAGTDYWLVKNSWGVMWGMHGYMKIARNRNNHCGIATYVMVPYI